MPEVTLEQAEQLLQEHGGYEWLLNGPEAWSAGDATENLGKTGISVSRDTVLRWFKPLPHTQDFGKLGLWASRNDLILFFAGRMRNEQTG